MMLATPISPNVYSISLGFVNVLLLTSRELTLIDSGIPGSEKKILQAMTELGFQARDLRHIIVTHLHYDHTGSLVELKKSTGAKIYMHALDAEAFTTGKVMRTIEPAPGLLNRLIVNSIQRQKPAQQTNPVKIDEVIPGDTEIPGTGGLRIIHTPGHTAGHLACLWPENDGILFVGDAASNMLHLGYSFLYENFAQGQQTLRKIGQMNFSKACFSHGKIIPSAANAKFREKF